MENNYRDMMDAVKAPEGLRMEVMNMSEQERTKKTRPLPVRVALAAACICALLATAAVAVEVIAGIQVSDPKTIPGQETGDLTGWTMVLPEGITEDQLSAEFLEDLQAAGPDTYGIKRVADKDFHTCEELRAYLGIAPTLNPILEQGDIGTLGDYTGWHLMAEVIEEAIHINVCGNFVIPVPTAEGKTIQVHLDAWINTEEQPWDGLYFDHVEEITQEDYVTENGLEAVISSVRFEPTGEKLNHYECRGGADFYLDGFAYSLKVWYNTQEVEEAQVTATLKSILNAFE